MISDLLPGHRIPGPAILIDDISTVVVEPECTAFITAGRDIRIEVGETAETAEELSTTECDPIQLAIFSHRSASSNPNSSEVVHENSQAWYDSYASQRLCTGHGGFNIPGFLSSIIQGPAVQVQSALTANLGCMNGCSPHSVLLESKVLLPACQVYLPEIILEFQTSKSSSGCIPSL